MLSIYLNIVAHNRCTIYDLEWLATTVNQVMGVEMITLVLGGMRIHLLEVAFHHPVTENGAVNLSPHHKDVLVTVRTPDYDKVLAHVVHKMIN